MAAPRNQEASAAVATQEQGGSSAAVPLTSRARVAGVRCHGRAAVAVLAAQLRHQRARQDGADVAEPDLSRVPARATRQIVEFACAYADAYPEDRQRIVAAFGEACADMRYLSCTGLWNRVTKFQLEACALTGALQERVRGLSACTALKSLNISRNHFEGS